MSDHPFDPGLQPERTRLAWQRTAISIAVGALVYARIEAGVLGLASWACAVIGAVGVSGDASDKDEYAAIEGVRAAGFTPHPETPSETWRDAGL